MTWTRAWVGASGSNAPVTLAAGGNATANTIFFFAALIITLGVAAVLTVLVARGRRRDQD